LDALRDTKGRHHANPETIGEAANRLYLALLHSRSSRAVLRLAEDDPKHLPGANGTLIWLDLSSPRRHALRFLGLRVGTVIDRTHPKTIHPLRSGLLHYQMLLYYDDYSASRFLLERAKGTNRVGLRYDG
jgi:hypothetical protein